MNKLPESWVLLDHVVVVGVSFDLAMILPSCYKCSRCAELSLVAIVNKLPESWICFRPVLPLMYASQYLPGISKFVFLIMYMSNIHCWTSGSVS